jgi:hypothetical protein
MKKENMVSIVAADKKTNNQTFKTINALFNFQNQMLIDFI